MLKLIRLYAGQAEELSDSEFRCYFNTSMLNRVRAITLKSCSFQNNQPNVFADDYFTNDSRNNNVFYYEVNGDKTVSIDVSGFYGITDVLAAINATFGVAYTVENPGGTAVLSLDPVSGRVQLVITGAVANPVTLTGSGVFSLNALIGNLNDLIAPAAGSYLLDSYPALAGMKSVTVSVRTKSPQTILNAEVSKERHVNSIGSVPVNAKYMEQQIFVSPSPADSMLNFSYVEDLRELTFILRDEFGRRLKGQRLNFYVEFIVMTTT